MSFSFCDDCCVQVAKLLSELDIVRRNIDVMSEIMTENQPGQESQDDYQLLEVRPTPAASCLISRSA